MMEKGTRRREKGDLQLKEKRNGEKGIWRRGDDVQPVKNKFAGCDLQLFFGI